MIRESNIKFIKSGEKKRLLNTLKEQFGISKLKSWIFVETGKGKIRGFSGSMTRDEIDELSEIANVEVIGLYLFRVENNRLRLSMDGSGIFGESANNGVVDIDENEMNVWIRGGNIERELENGIYIIKNGDDFLGCGISDGKKLINHVPKERRIRNG
ncbi:MAG: hypothetical protein Q8P57_05270 [Candidatus Pacearchaeota archaeon]|nr:hypothetical protein [Candidatus Pacearchaeota archaeon]